MLDRARKDDPEAMRILERHWRAERSAGQARPAAADHRRQIGRRGASARVITASTDGETLTTRQGLDLSTMIEYRRRALEAVEFEADLREIEAHDAKVIEDGPKKRRW